MALVPQSIESLTQQYNDLHALCVELNEQTSKIANNNRALQEQNLALTIKNGELIAQNAEQGATITYLTGLLSAAGLEQV